MAGNKAKRKLEAGEKPEVKSRYVHMMHEDYATWTSLLKSDQNELDEVWYDVHVGRPMAVPAGSPAYMQDVANGVSRKRIDVVGRIGSSMIIIEVKPHANMEAIGQVITYADLFIEEFEIHGSVSAMIVATTCDADILEIARRQNVKIIALEGVTL